jgi:hypothetical protein
MNKSRSVVITGANGFVGKKIKIRKIDFETTYCDALQNKGSFGLDDLSIM